MLAAMQKVRFGFLVAAGSHLAWGKTWLMFCRVGLSLLCTSDQAAQLSFWEPAPIWRSQCVGVVRGLASAEVCVQRALVSAREKQLAELVTQSDERFLGRMGRDRPRHQCSKLSCDVLRASARGGRAGMCCLCQLVSAGLVSAARRWCLQTRSEHFARSALVRDRILEFLALRRPRGQPVEGLAQFVKHCLAARVEGEELGRAHEFAKYGPGGEAGAKEAASIRCTEEERRRAVKQRAAVNAAVEAAARKRRVAQQKGLGALFGGLGSPAPPTMHSSARTRVAVSWPTERVVVSRSGVAKSSASLSCRAGGMLASEVRSGPCWATYCKRKS